MSAFVDAQQRIKAKTQLPNDALLALYALFKQATVGDASGSRPGMFDVKGRAKYDAWAQKRGLTKAEAEAAYVTLVEQLLAR